MQILHWLQDLPVVVKVLGSLAAILGLNTTTRKLLPSVLAGVIILAWWSGHSLCTAAAIAWERLISPGNLALLLVTFLVIWLSTQMAQTGIMRELVIAITERLPQRLAFAALPAVIGFLPMPGGALFSAPLVDDCDHEQVLKPLHKAQINYWFRHVWEYWWPLYPGVLLAIEITRLPMPKFMLLQLPLALISIAAGYLFFLRRVPRPPAASTRTARQPLLPLAAPILVVVLVYTLASLPGLELGRYNRYLPMLLGLTAAMVLLQRERPLTREQWRQIVLAKSTLGLVGMVAAIRVYGAFIETRLPSGQLLVEAMRADFQAWGFPALVVIALLPFVSGLASGLAIGFVGISFPVVVSLVDPQAAAPAPLAVITIAYAFGYMGMILSPVHICLLVTNEHFKTSLLRSIVSLIRPAIVVLAGAFGYYLLLRLGG